MGIFDRFKPRGMLSGQNIADASELRSWSGEQVHVDIRRMSPLEMYRSQPNLRTVIGFKANAISHCRLHAFEMSADGEERQRDRRSVLARLLRNPNEEMTGKQLIYATVADRALYDECYWWITRDIDRDIGWSIIWLPVPWVTPKNLDAFRRKEYEVKAPGADKTTIPAAEILHFHGYNPDDPRKGLSAIDALKDILEEQMQAAQYRKQVWKRGGRVSSVLTRPVGAPRWGRKAREQFRDDWYSSYTGAGPGSGGTPILDDGMQLQKVGYSAQEEQYVESNQLALKTVAMVYLISPTLIGASEGTFSNTREYRKMLYVDTLGGEMGDMEDTITLRAYGKIEDEAALGDDERHYVEFNIREKLQGDFSETAKSLQSAIGGPWMLADEGRAISNLPPLPDGQGQQLVVPSNVVRGGGPQASPNDSGEQNQVDEPVQEPRAAASRGTLVLLKSRPVDKRKDDAAARLRKFFDRQERAVRSRLGKSRFKADDGWWDEERWDDELSAELLALASDVAGEIGPETAKALGYSESDYDPERTVEFLSAVAVSNARNINEATRQAVLGALESDDVTSALDSTFTVARETRSVAAGTAIVTAAAGFATCEAATQVAPEEATVTKTWVTGSNPRPTHAQMNGETVGIDEAFSNGAQWPADMNLDADESAGCNCSVDVNIEASQSA